MRTLIICMATTVFILLVSDFPAHAQSSSRPQNEIEARGVYSIPSGEANFSSAGTSGTTLSFGRDFDFKNQLGFELRYTYNSTSGKHKFLASYARTSWDRSTTISRSFAFNGRIYLANVNLESDLKLTVFRGMYAYRWGNEKVRFGPMLDLGVVSTKLNINGTTTSGPVSTEGSISKFAATIGYDLDYYPSSRVNIFHNLGGIAFRGDHLFHTEGGAKFFVSERFGVTGGYKVQRYSFVDGANFITIRAHGPFFGGVFRF
jgi:hypothetical protein